MMVKQLSSFSLSFKRVRGPPRSIAMTDHYDNLILLERLSAYKNLRPSVEQFWGLAEQPLRIAIEQ
jgi:hypothetical protein